MKEEEASRIKSASDANKSIYMNFDEETFIFSSNNSSNYEVEKEREREREREREERQKKVTEETRSV